MKKLLSIVILLALAVVATSCSSPSDTAAEPTNTPVDEVEPEPETIPAAQPTLEPLETSRPVYAPSEYVYATVTSNALGLTIKYPAHWINIPGRHTICYIEPVEAGEIPARMAVSVKKLSKKPDKEKLQGELGSFMKAILAQYDSYQVGSLSDDSEFVGSKGYSSVYSAMKDGVEIRGYCIVNSYNASVYGYHFSAQADAYMEMGDVIRHIRESVTRR